MLSGKIIIQWSSPQKVIYILIAKESGDLMEKTINCGSCYKEFIPFTYPVIFEDCALVFTNCPSCEFEILLAIVKDAEFYSLQRRITYGVLAERMKSDAEFINDRTNLKSARNQTAHEFINTLIDFTKDSSLAELTKIFTAHPDKGSLFKYSAASISKFINMFYNKFQPFTKFDYLGNIDSFSWIEDNFRSLAITSKLLAELDSDDPPTVEPQFMQIKANLRTLMGNFPFGQEMGEYMENMPSKRSINQEIKNENLAIIDVAKTMYQKYTNRQTNLINLFQVTDKIIPLEPSREEKATREFFKNNPDDQIVLPGPDSLNIFQADRERFLSLLAQASSQPIKIVTDSTLTYNLFLSQIAREIEHYANHPILSQVTLLSTPNARAVPGFRTVSFLAQYDFDSQELNNEQGPQTTYLLPKNHLYETGRFIGPITFQLSQPSLSDLEFILGQFAPNIAQLYHVQFAAKVLTEIALGTQNIHTSIPAVDQAINWLDEVAAASTLKKTASPITVTVSDVQKMFASKYNSYATTTFDTNTIRQLKAHLNKHVIAQPKATKAVTDDLMRTSLGLNNPNRPLATMLFVGPTGVGKTELAKQLAFELYGSETEFIRFDMSEYVDERASIIKFIGLTGQYKNSEIEGELIVAVRDHPNAIILFDEFEKSS